jgi:hypothetical protein
VFEVTANGATNEGTISFGLGAVSAMSAIEDVDNASILLPTEFSLAALEGVFSFSSPSGVDTLVATGVNLGNSPMTYTIDNQEALNVSMEPLGFTVNGADQTATLDTALDTSLSIANINSEFSLYFGRDPDPALQGTLAMTAPMGTSITNLGPPPAGLNNDVFVLSQGGPLSVTGTGYHAGDVTVNTNECFTESSDTFPIATATCP